MQPFQVLQESRTWAAAAVVPAPSWRHGFIVVPVCPARDRQRLRDILLH